MDFWPESFTPRVLRLQKRFVYVPSSLKRVVVRSQRLKLPCLDRSVNEKKWLVMHMHVQLQLSLKRVKKRDIG